MKLGAFSVSLAVKDIDKSRNFYRALGFIEVGGDIAQHWLIMRNDTHTIGLFQGMFDKNMLTFNPGWNSDCEPLDEFTDVRDIQAALKQQGIELSSEVDPSSKGAGSFMLIDPDGNPILIDQHL
ncbi:VOC family protein [Arenicella xantha]|uniref:Catechol 2,3-dioxygenase-like lactoylglutathione lyase family enzyme n=1 Tax=Arenicella xantha TaxID=644221 RepID=A0A395JND4_9GAMM|nr:VOC family protein [Arenicella xantha]RBP53180.1 catechol 2,3-dioxygenase-like lactoylglutathione lyase family enzyme [Arenicella xantha]